MDNKDVCRLTQKAECAGCAAKIGPAILEQVLRGLIQPPHPNFLVGFEKADDAGVYKLTDEIAMVQTIDFFPPIVDDPNIFGQIAAANALSDVYAMGGKPLTALNVVAFPINDMDIAVLREILKGSLQKLDEAGVTLVGGHSIEDKELKYGLAVTGIIHPDKIITNDGAKVGDNIVLTKPLGTGIINTALKGGLASPEVTQAAEKVMTTLNKVASSVMLEIGVNACTDVTGFGLLGHLSEMVAHSQVGVEIEIASVPILDKADEFARMGLVPAGTYRNRKFREPMVKTQTDIPEHLINILFDAQTSGGLLMAVSNEKAQDLIKRLHSRGVKDARIIGEVVSEPKGIICLT